MKLKNVIKGIDVISIRGSKETEIAGVSCNSKLVSPGSLFIAKKGRQYDGSRFIPEAVSAGARAIVSDLFDPFIKMPQVIVKDAAAVEGRIAANYYNYPANELFMIGVTGTNGKTTASYLIKHILDKSHKPSGLLGTVEYILGQSRIKAQRTTLDVVMNQRYLREMINSGLKCAVMEVTSHALDQGRVDFIDFDAAIFTNLTQDHLDYHVTMENYLAAKAKLFSSLGEDALAIVNGDDPAFKELICGSEAKILTYGLKEENDLYAKDISFDPAGTKFIAVLKGNELPFKTKLCGRFNVYNTLAAIGAALQAKIPFESLPHIIADFSTVNGRLEAVETGSNFSVFVDYAHTDDALKNVLLTLREIKRGRIITVFGCGGDRDRGKRPKMAAACEAFSDYSVITSDNPRSEEPMAIIRDIVAGFKDADRFEVEEDRYRAIKRALAIAEDADIVLIAGKGHEDYQILKDRTIPFDDRAVVKTILGL